jgi:hypothetical protein
MRKKVLHYHDIIIRALLSQRYQMQGMTKQH